MNSANASGATGVTIGIFGIRGRMGAALTSAIADAGLAAVGADRGDDPRALAVGCQVIVDFSAPEALQAHLDAARAARVPILVGTTGLGDAHSRAIDAAARDIPVLQAANTALGVNLLAALVEQGTARLGEDWDVEIVEMHHRDKRDAPSGTALMLAEAAARGRGKLLDDLRHDPGRPREPGGIGLASLRGGSVAGDHLVVLAAQGERIELGHRAEDRGIFARGAVTAARWLIGKPASRYTMADVLGL